jgi:hypothetical protein
VEKMRNAYKIILQLSLYVPMFILANSSLSHAQEVLGVLCSEWHEEECRVFKRSCEQDFDVIVNIISLPENHVRNRVRIEESEALPLIDLWISNSRGYILHNSRNKTIAEKCALNAGMKIIDYF